MGSRFRLPTRSRVADAEQFIARQERLYGLLACPRCEAGLGLHNDTRVAGAVLAGDLMCPDHGRVGVVSAFQPSFLDRELDAVPEGTRPTMVLTPVDLNPLVGTSTGWFWTDAGYTARGEQNDSLTVKTKGRGLRLSFYGNEWSGIVRVETSDGDVTEHDLYRPVFEPVHIETQLRSGGKVRVVATGRHAEPSLGSQVILGRIDERVDVDKAHPPELAATNRGNPYPPRFDELCAQQAPDAAILDCGGGDRRYGDDRVFNLEYLSFELPDLFGDGLALPFASGSFDLIMSQAVLEHVSDPQRAVDEMVRVLKPGGTLLIEVAYMQPLHAVPHHFMNVTPHGLAHLCRGLETVEAGTQGGISDLVEWVGRITDAPGKIGPSRFDNALEALRDLDQACTRSELDSFAFTSFIEARKPTAGRS